MDQSDLKFMQQAIEEARNCEPEHAGDPLVGAVVSKGGHMIGAGHRGETGIGDHAEFGLLQKKELRSTELLEGSTLYTTLEPCISRSHDKLPCASWVIRKKISRVVIGMLDPNPNICGRGYWRLLDAGIKVDFFPFDEVQQIMDLNRAFIALHRDRDTHVDAEFAKIVQRYKSRAISPYTSLGWGDDLSLQDSPHFREGWHLSDVEVLFDPTHIFELPERYRDGYERYLAMHRSKGQFDPDNTKLFLYQNPTAFSDFERLRLIIGSSRWSQVQFYKDEIAPTQSERGRLIEEAIRGSLEIRFPHSLCMHMIVVTADSKLLLTRRSPKVAYFPGTWSASVEEQLAVKDLNDGPQKVVLNWCRRLLYEELGLGEQHCPVEDMRILSVFLETDVLNVSLCAFSELTIDSVALSSIIGSLDRTDYEFTEIDFIDLQKEDLLQELLHPPRPQHPSTGYRLLKTLLRQFGRPSDLEVKRFSAVAS